MMTRVVKGARGAECSQSSDSEYSQGWISLEEGQEKKGNALFCFPVQHVDDIHPHLFISEVETLVRPSTSSSGVLQGVAH
jgi:hypothetical protein